MSIRGLLAGPRAFACIALLTLTACFMPSPVDCAMSLARRHREGEGVALLRAEIAAHPGNVDARRLLVRLLGLTGELPAARTEATALEKLLPEGDPSAWIELGHAYELAHHFEDALAAYDTAASAAPGSPAGPLEGGMRAAHWGEADEARPRLEEAVRRGVNDAEVWHALGIVRLHQQDLEGAGDAYRRGLATDASRPENWLGLASIAVVQDDAKGALDAYTALLALRPAFAPAELGRAWALAKLGRREDAKRALDHAEELGAPRTNVAKQRAALATPTPTPTID